MGDDVIAVASDAKKKKLSDDQALGAGGAGTARAWLAARTKAGATRRVFCKMHAATTFEATWNSSVPYVLGAHRKETRAQIR